MGGQRLTQCLSAKVLLLKENHPGAGQLELGGLKNSKINGIRFEKKEDICQEINACKFMPM